MRFFCSLTTEIGSPLGLAVVADDLAGGGEPGHALLEQLPRDAVRGVDHGGALHARHARRVVRLIVEEDHLLQTHSSLLRNRSHVVVLPMRLVDLRHILLEHVDHLEAVPHRELPDALPRPAGLVAGAGHRHDGAAPLGVRLELVENVPDVAEEADPRPALVRQRPVLVVLEGRAAAPQLVHLGVPAAAVQVKYEHFRN